MKKLGDNYRLFYTSGLRSEIPNNFKLPNMFPLGKLSECDLIKEYNKCDLLLLPTRHEGFGYVVAEAMSCGKPIISTNCSSIPELVVDKKGGFLCKIDDVNDFISKIKIISKNIKMQQEMGKFNRKQVLEKFSLRKMVGQYQIFYSNLIKHQI
jgi:glycosyltransferase involved in cell wall biosynthesis